MKTIKFSDEYMKLPIVWKGTQAVLIAVTPMDIDWLKGAIPSFIEYDTKFRAKEGNYPLNFKDGLVLTFIHLNTGIPFTTIRRNYKEKFEYYASSIGETFNMIFEKKGVQTNGKN